MDAVTTMREGTLHDFPGVYRVCRLTGHAGRDATSRHADPDLLGHLWAGPYLAFPEAVTRVIHDDQGVAGYCLAVPDAAAFEHWLDTVWLPPLRERLPLGSGATEADRALVARIHQTPRSDAALLAEHPAHLHVDLLPRLQGQGWGRRIMDEVVGELSREGVPGIHLGVDPGNTAAPGFYQRLGFRPVTGPPGARWYGILLA